MPANGLFGAFEQRSPYVGDNFRSIFLACIIHYRSSLSVHVRFIHWHQSPSDGLDLGRLNHEKQRGLVLPEPYEQPIANPKALLVNEILPDSILTPMCWIATDLGSSLRQRRKSYVTLPLRSAVDVVSDLYVSAIDGWRFCRLLRSMSCTVFNAILIVLVSGTFQEIDSEEVSAQIGANAFLSAAVFASFRWIVWG